MKRVSASELGGVGDHLVGGGESMRGHAHAHRTTLRYVLPWHAWKTCSDDKKENVNETIFPFSSPLIQFTKRPQQQRAHRILRHFDCSAFSFDESREALLHWAALSYSEWFTTPSSTVVGSQVGKSFSDIHRHSNVQGGCEEEQLVVLMWRSVDSQFPC